MLTPGEMSQSDADAVFAAGWDEQALHDAVAITARAAFMQRLVEGHGFAPMSREVAAQHARRRVELGYVNLHPAFRATGSRSARRLRPRAARIFPVMAALARP
jgi:hypothetical protein